MARKTYIKGIQEALAEEMRRDDCVMLMGEDVRLGVFAGTRGLHTEFGDGRVIDTPISELAVAGAGVGAAATGLRPVVDLMFGTFLYLAFDQIANQAGSMRYMFGGQATLPLVYMTQNGAGSSAGHHHSQSVHQFFMNMPLIKVVLPSTPYDVKGLLKSAIRDDNPVVFLNSLSLGGKRGDIPDEEYTIPLGVADMKREGADVTICTVGAPVYTALDAAKQLEKGGVSVEVIDLRTLSPWDKDTVLASVQKTGRFVAVDEAFPQCSAASEWTATIAREAFSDLKAAPQQVNNEPVPVPFSPKLEKAVLPTTEKIINAVKRTLE
ncbi:MAG: alpha-ketoacid dehydrogenase subunit beta [Chloroflexota bacterium]